MKSIDSYITERFKIQKDIANDSKGIISQDIQDRIFDILKHFTERTSKGKDFDPSVEISDSNYKSYRMYPIKKDRGFYVFGNSPEELYNAVAKNYGTKEEKEEASNYKKETQN